MFSKTTKYAIRAVTWLAVHSSDADKRGVTEIAEALDVPRHFLAKILQQLSRENLISSTKGPGGGFYLSDEDKNGSLDEVVKCLEGQDVFSGCILGLPACSSENPCPLHFQALALKNGFYYQFKHTTIGELAVRIEREGMVI